MDALERETAKLMTNIAAGGRDGESPGCTARAAEGPLLVQGALTGSVFSSVPVVLVEMVTLSNASDARFITDLRGQSLMAQAIGEGIGRFSPASNSPRTWQ